MITRHPVTRSQSACSGRSVSRVRQALAAAVMAVAAAGSGLLIAPPGAAPASAAARPAAPGAM